MGFNGNAKPLQYLSLGTGPPEALNQRPDPLCSSMLTTYIKLNERCGGCARMSDGA